MKNRITHHASRIMRLTSAVAVGIIAFFELCLTGRAAYAWRLAKRGAEVTSRSRRPGTKAGPLQSC